MDFSPRNTRFTPNFLPLQTIASHWSVYRVTMRLAGHRLKAYEGILTVIVLPGGSSPRPPFSRFARRAVHRYRAPITIPVTVLVLCRLHLFF
jgi:hypothetical protein